MNANLERLADTFFNWQVMAQYAPKIWEGFWVTVGLALAVIVAGISSGLVLALVRSFRLRLLNFLIVVLVDMLRALPPLVLIVGFYFALPSLGIKLSAWVATWLALALVLMAFSEEIFWAGIVAVPRGQWEAARSTGLTFWQTLSQVVAPQAVRMTIPPLTNRTIAITKGTALGAVVAVGEILYQAQTAYSFSYNPSPLVLGSIAYLVLFIPVVIFGRWVETRFAWKR
ncbi:MAG TPA: amino acid ABC transporter permease [Burkholderiaceae bacterium]